MPTKITSTMLIDFICKNLKGRDDVEMICECNDEIEFNSENITGFIYPNGKIRTPNSIWEIYFDHKDCFNKISSCPISFAMLDAEVDDEMFFEKLLEKLNLLGSQEGYNLSDNFEYLDKPHLFQIDIRDFIISIKNPEEYFIFPKKKITSKEQVDALSIISKISPDSLFCLDKIIEHNLLKINMSLGDVKKLSIEEWRVLSDGGIWWKNSQEGFVTRKQ